MNAFCIFLYENQGDRERETFMEMKWYNWNILKLCSTFNLGFWIKWKCIWYIRKHSKYNRLEKCFKSHGFLADKMIFHIVKKRLNRNYKHLIPKYEHLIPKQKYLIQNQDKKRLGILEWICSIYKNTWVWNLQFIHGNTKNYLQFSIFKNLFVCSCLLQYEHN